MPQDATDIQRQIRRGLAEASRPRDANASPVTGSPTTQSSTTGNSGMGGAPVSDRREGGGSLRRPQSGQDN